MAKLMIGNRKVTIAKAKDWVRDYTDPGQAESKKPFGYPWYDTYDTGESDLLVDGDLLAPILLNVRPSIAAYASLSRMRPELNEVLATIDIDESLLDVEDVEAIGQLFAPLDGKPRPFGVKATTLAKVLHRKRPRFVPLFDREVRASYFEKHGATAPRLTTHRAESWADYMMNIVDAIRCDILAACDDWEAVQAANRGSEPISLLRTFDIVAWRCGKAGS
jgi:hypothetical protein